MPMEERILIADHHPDNGKMLADYFRSIGYKAIWRRTAQALLEQAIFFQPHVIILELRLTFDAGFNLISDLKQITYPQGSHIICISANTDQRLIDHAKASGASAFLAKPFTNAALKAQIDRLTFDIPSPSTFKRPAKEYHFAYKWF